MHASNEPTNFNSLIERNGGGAALALELFKQSGGFDCGVLNRRGAVYRCRLALGGFHNNRADATLVEVQAPIDRTSLMPGWLARIQRSHAHGSSKICERSEPTS